MTWEKTFIKINSQKLEILSTSKRRTFLLKDIKKVQIEKIKLRREIPYIVKLELKNERKETLVKSFYCKELILVKKEILKYKNKGEINEIF